MIQVVVVERDPALARLYQEELTEAGFEVRVRRGVDEACASLRHRPAHVLVTDLTSMGGSLPSCLAHLRRVHMGPVVILGPEKRGRLLPDRDLQLVDKSSDLTPLISFLRGKTVGHLWTRAQPATC